MTNLTTSLCQFAQCATDARQIDEQTTEKVEIFIAALQDSGYLALKTVRPHVADGVLYLKGTVNSYSLKQLAQETVRPFAVGLQIRNELKVG